MEVKQYIKLRSKVKTADMAEHLKKVRSLKAGSMAEVWDTFSRQGYLDDLVKITTCPGAHTRGALRSIALKGLEVPFADGLSALEAPGYPKALNAYKTALLWMAGRASDADLEKSVEIAQEDLNKVYYQKAICLFMGGSVNHIYSLLLATVAPARFLKNNPSRAVGVVFTEVLSASRFYHFAQKKGGNKEVPEEAMMRTKDAQLGVIRKHGNPFRKK